MLELKIGDVELCLCTKFAEDSANSAASGSIAVEVDGIEAHKLQHVFDVDIFEVDSDGVRGVFRGNAVDDEVLLTMADGEVLDVEELVGVSDEAALDVPVGVVDVDDRRHDGNVGR